MEKAKNKRQCRRQACEAPIEWTYFNHGQFRNAVKRNDGCRGFYFESPNCPKINASIFIKPVNGCSHNAPKNDSTCYRTAALARVKWIKLIKPGDDPLYGIGAEYCDSTFDLLF